MRKLVLLLTLSTPWVAAFASPVDVEFLRFNWTGQWQSGYPYWVYILGSGVMPVMCDDYVHGGDPGFTWLANETNLGSKDLTLTRFGSMNGALTLYDEAGWLLLQTGVQPINQWKLMNAATWNLFDPSAPCDSGCEMWLAAAQDEANRGFPNINFNLVGILTPTDKNDPNPNDPQEFLYLEGGVGPVAITNGGVGSTPEPGTLVLLGTGAAALWRRRQMS
jgi:hypothetical protein